MNHERLREVVAGVFRGMMERDAKMFTGSYNAVDVLDAIVDNVRRVDEADRKVQPYRYDAKAYEERLKLVDEMEKLFDLIVAEFNSDPMSVQCFDLRVVERARLVNALLRSAGEREGQ